MQERQALHKRYDEMQNRAMRDKLERGECVDLSTCAHSEDGSYVIPAAVWQDGVDYCDAKSESWIWSIGRERATGQILASTDSRYYANDAFECLFLR